MGTATTMSCDKDALPLVIAGSISLWLIIQWIGPLIGLAGRYAILADLAVMAALIWALINCFFIWRKRQDT